MTSSSSWKKLGSMWLSTTRLQTPRRFWRSMGVLICQCLCSRFITFSVKLPSAVIGIMSVVKHLTRLWALQKMGLLSLWVSSFLFYLVLRQQSLILINYTGMRNDFQWETTNSNDRISCWTYYLLLLLAYNTGAKPIQVCSTPSCIHPFPNLLTSLISHHRTSWRSYRNRSTSTASSSLHLIKSGAPHSTRRFQSLSRVGSWSIRSTSGTGWSRWGMWFWRCRRGRTRPRLLWLLLMIELLKAKGVDDIWC